MKTFTVIGYWSDSRQRYAKGVYAESGDQAERDCLLHSENDGGELRICAVVAGWSARIVDRGSRHGQKHHFIGDRSALVGAVKRATERAIRDSNPK